MGVTCRPRGHSQPSWALPPVPDFLPHVYVFGAQEPHFRPPQPAVRPSPRSWEEAGMRCQRAGWMVRPGLSYSTADLLQSSPLADGRPPITL